MQTDVFPVYARQRRVEISKQYNFIQESEICQFVLKEMPTAYFSSLQKLILCPNSMFLRPKYFL